MIADSKMDNEGNCNENERDQIEDEDQIAAALLPKNEDEDVDETKDDRVRGDNCELIVDLHTDVIETDFRKADTKTYVRDGVGVDTAELTTIGSVPLPPPPSMPPPPPPLLPPPVSPDAPPLPTSKTLLVVDDMISSLDREASCWSLAHDNELATTLFHVSWYLRHRVHTVALSIDRLERRTERLSCEVSSVRNDLILRGDRQFLEHCVYDDYETNHNKGDHNENHVLKMDSKNVTDDQLSTGGRSEGDGGGSPSRVTVEKEAIIDGMNALDIFVDPAKHVVARQQQQQEQKLKQQNQRRMSDDEKMTIIGDCCYYYESAEMDAFNHRPLPFVIGSMEFRASGEDAGLGGEEIRSLGKNVEDGGTESGDEDEAAKDEKQKQKQH